MSDEKPNILLILADEHRADCLGAYGNEEVSTPNLDNLAKNGVVFDRAFCSSPLCAPSRYSILTGLYPHQNPGWKFKSTSEVFSVHPGNNVSWSGRYIVLHGRGGSNG